MAANWMRRTLLTTVAAASVSLLAACGSSNTANSIKPDSFLVFGDTMSDIGQNANGVASGLGGTLHGSRVNAACTARDHSHAFQCAQGGNLSGEL